MTPTVHILASVRKAELLPAALMVFDSIRVGFPTAKIVVYGNNLHHDALAAVSHESRCVGAGFVNINPTFHHEWVEELIKSRSSPFIICDTDVVFWSKVEDWEFILPLAGRHIPDFNCEFTKARTMERLHTSLLFIEPVDVRKAMAAYGNAIPATYFTPKPNLIYPQFVPLAQDGLPALFGKSMFFDTCAMLYHAIGGSAFVESELDCYDHLHAGTISDLVGPHITDGKMQERHRQIFANPKLARGIWRSQQAYFNDRSPNRTTEAECACV